jgi:hypothetical protein
VAVQWLWFSLIASVVLTVVLNVAIRLWPGAAERGAERMDDWASRQPSSELGSDRGVSDRGVRVIVPWKAMLLGSLLLTVVLNVLIRLG